MKQWTNTFIGFLLLLFALIIYFLIPSQIGIIETARMSLSPSFYPRLVIVTMVVISSIYLVSSFFGEKKKHGRSKGKKADQREARILGENPLRTLITVMIILGYVYLLEFLGFLIATPIGLFAFSYHMGNRRIKTFCLIMIIVPLAIYFFFEKVMLIFLPEGTVFY